MRLCLRFDYFATFRYRVTTVNCIFVKTVADFAEKTMIV